MADSYDHLAGSEMDAKDHPDNSMRYDNVHEQGKSMLKEEMSNIFDVPENKYPDSPHYSEHQDDLTAFSNRFRKSGPDNAF